MSEQPTLLSTCTSGGCGAKIGPGELSKLLKDLPAARDPRLLVGFDASDDAAVYDIGSGRAMVMTADFFPAMVDDARLFGRIAATNALSDVYAMGATPAVALNLVCFPEKLPREMLGEILAGGAEKVAEAGAVIGGGHSIYDHEPKYGLAVTGFGDLDRILRNDTPKVGHRLILTKPLGVGIVMLAARNGIASDAAREAALWSMQRLNRYAAEKMRDFDVSACTDVTGFGLLAHLREMCAGDVTAEIHPSSLPVIPEAAGYAEMGWITAGGGRNRAHFGTAGAVDSLPPAVQEVLFDPQTSGGLLICVDAEQAPALLDAIRADDPAASIIGTILPAERAKVVFRDLP